MSTPTGGNSLHVLGSKPLHRRYDTKMFMKYIRPSYYMANAPECFCLSVFFFCILAGLIPFTSLLTGSTLLIGLSVLGFMFLASALFLMLGIYSKISYARERNKKNSST